MCRCSPRALAILAEMRGQHAEVIFPGWRPGRPVDDNTVSRAFQRLAGPLTAHGFRSALRTWAAERTNFAPEIAEAALAHAIQSGIERAYKRTTFFDHRRKLMEAWAAYCEGAATVTGGEVVAMRGRPPWLASRKYTDAAIYAYARDWRDALDARQPGEEIRLDLSMQQAILHRFRELIEAERNRKGRPALPAHRPRAGSRPWRKSGGS